MNKENSQQQVNIMCKQTLPEINKQAETQDMPQLKGFKIQYITNTIFVLFFKVREKLRFSN